MEMTSYDELLKQVRSLRAENSNLRQELTDNTCHLTAIETEASGVTDAMATDPLDVDDDSDNDINYDENGIHVFHQGGGGEGRDLISSVEEDISPNDVYGLKPFHVPAPDTSHPHNGLATHQNGLATQSPQDRPDQTYNKDVHTELLEHVKALLIERSEILRQIQDEDQQRKWYIAQLDNIRQKLEKIPYHDGYNRQSEAARGKVEYEAKQLQESFEQSFGTQEQISQRQDVRLQRVHAIESTVRQIQQQHRDKIDLTSLDVTSSQEPQSHHNVQMRKSRDESVAGPNPGMNSENGDSSVIDPAVMNLASLYHGAWPLSPMKRDSSSHSSREGSAQNVGQDVASVMSFNSNSTHNSHPPGAPRQLVPMATPQATPSQPQTDAQQPQHFGTKVEMVYSLLSMLGSNDKDDMSRTLLAMSSSQDSCIAMRQSGCLPLLIQLLHGSDKDSGLLGNTRGSKAARARAAAALHNIVHSHPDDKRGRREARVLRLLEQIRAHCDQLRESMSEEEEEGKGHRDIKSPSDMDHHPGPAVAALMKLSFDEEHRHAICSLGGVQAIAELIQVDQEAVGNTSEQYNITMRRYGCMALTNLTFGDGTNKALLCSMRGFMTALVAQLESECEDLNQVSASVLRNLSWKADLQSKKTLRAVGVAATLMRAAMRVKKEPTLKSILSALWNLSAHGSENKADICAVDGALEFLVGTLTYKSPSKTTAVIENGGGVLRNISSHITVREDYRQILRKHGCLQILLKQLRSTSLNIVSNACGTLWNLSARCPEDQQALWDMGAVGMLRNLVHSKHQMIAMGSSAALKNLLSAGPTIKSTGMDKKAISNRPSLHVRKQKALVEEIDHSLAETCENLESPRDSPTENNRTEKDNTHFKFPLNPNIVQADVESRRLAVRDHIYPQSKSGENTPMSDSRLMSPSRVARSGSQDSVGSTHSDISHDRSRFHIAMKTAKQYHDRKGGSLDRNCGGNVQRFNSDGSCERNNTGTPGSSRILQVMKEVANYAGIESENQRNVPPNSSQCSTPRKDPNFSLPHTLLYRSFTGPSHSQSFPVSQNHAKPQPGNFHFRQDEDDQQPIDYSMKYNQKNFNPNKSNNQGPPVPKYGNFMSPRSDSGTVVMQNSFQGNTSQSSFRMHQMAPVIPQLSAYAETDLDSDQPVDYSLRYAESQEFMKERAVSYGAQYTGTPQNPADYNYQVARRTNDLLEQYGNIPGYDDDQVKTFCTEGTPRNYLSTANSLTDLSNKVDGKAGLPEEQNDDDNSDDQEEDLEHESHRSGSSSLVNSQTADGDVNSGTASLSTNQDTSTTLLANYHVATKNLHQVVFGNASKREGTESHSFHAPSVNDHSPDQTKTYCEEGTPICFSRVSSLSSLHSGDYRDSHGHAEKDSTKPCKGLSKISEHEGSRTPPRNGKVINSIMAPPKYTPMTGRQKMLGQPDSHGPDSAEKEHKTVTFNDDNQVQETPLMFSRCSSLGSLSSFDAQSVHSSVISDYSRRASEVVSPSELPDSPSETMPPSPSKSPEPTVRSNNQSNTQNSVDPPNICQSIEGTPRTVLFRPKPRIEENNTKIKSAEVSSTISCDEAPIVYADEGTPPHMSETNSVLSKLTIDDAERKKSVQKPQEESEKDVDCNLLNQSDDKENSSMSEVSEGEEDILKQCMSSALPPKMRRSSSDNTIKKKTMGNLREHQKSRQLKPIEDKVDGNTPKGKISYQGSQSQQEDPQDTVKLFASEDIPGQSAKPQHSKSETVTTSKSKTSKALVAGKREGIASNSSTDNGDDTVKSYAEEDLPFIEKKQKLKVMIPKNVQKAVYQENESSPDYVCSYANEGLPSSNTKIPRPRPKHFGKIQEILQGNLDHLDMEGDSMMSFAVEDTPFSGSVPISPQTASTTGPHFGKFDPKMLEKVDNQVEDEAPKSYACEDTPYNMSEPTSPKPTVKKAPPPVMQKPKRIPRFNPAQGYGSALLAATQDCHVDEEMPKSYAVEDTPVTSEPVSPKRQENKMVSQYGYLGSSSTMVAIEAEIPCDDSVKHYATEDTPVNFSHATSLSDLSIITSNEPIKEEEENLDEVEPEQKSPKENDEIEDDKPSNNENGAITNKDLINSEDQCQNVNEENSDENESDNSSSLDDSEDLLSDIIQSAMPKGKMSPKLKVSRKLDMDRAAEGAESLETKSSKAGFHPLRTSSLTSQIPQRKNTSSNYEHVNISNISEQHSKLWQHSSEVSRVENSSYSMSQVRDVQNNGMPSIIQQTSSYKIITSQTSQQGTSRSAADDSVFYHTNESSDSMRHYNVEGTPQTFSRNDSLSSLSIIDEDMRDPCTQTSKSCTNSFTKLPIKTSKEIEMQREVEGQSSDETKSVSNQTDSGQKSDDNKSDSEVCQAMQQQENDKEAINVRRSSSGSQLMSNKPEKKDDDTDEDDDLDEALQDALLEECMNSALPKSRSRNFDEKPKAVQSVPTMTNIPNKGPHLIKPDARKRSNRASLDSNIQLEKTMQIVVQTKGKDYVFDKYKQHRLSRSCSSADEMEVMNHSKGNTSHDSRAAQFRRQQINPNKSADFQFVKPSNDYRRVPPHGSWRRSRSQDSDGFLKRQKDSSNLEIAQSYGRMRQSGNSQQSIPTYIDTSGYYDNRMLEEQQMYMANYTGQNAHAQSLDRLSDRVLDTQEKFDHEKAYAITHGRSRHYSLPQNDELEMMNRSVSQREHNNEALIYNFGIDNLGFETGGSSENVQNEDSADVTLQGIIESSNNTMCADDDQSHMYPHRSFDENISVEDQKALEIDASLIVSAIQNNRMMGSSVDEDMFIENETLSLVSGGYMSDTPSDVSVTWSVHSENISESTTLSLNDDNSNASGPRIIKPSGKQMTMKEVNEKGVRGRRKPLYSPRTSTSVPETKTIPDVMKGKRPLPAAGRGRGRDNLAVNNSIGRRPVSTKTHPQASSTPTKSAPPKSKLQKPSPPQRQISNTSVNKGSPSRLPLASTKKSNNSAERPKPPVKQGTFTKQNSQNKNVPVIGLDHTDADDLQCTNSDTWTKALGSYNFVADHSVDEKKENQAPKKKGSLNTTPVRKGNDSINRNKFTGSNQNISKNTKTVTKPSNTSTSNLRKTYSGSSLTKSGSGQSLNKSGSGSMLNKTGSKTSLNKSVSGASLNKSSSDRVLNRSNPSLSRKELNKSDSSTSLKSNSRPSTPVGRKGVGGPLKKEDSVEVKTRTIPTGKKQVNSKIAGLWKKEDGNSESVSPRTSASKLPLSYSTPSRIRQPSAHITSKGGKSPAGGKTVHQTNFKSESPCDGMSRSSTYDKIKSINDVSQIPCLEEEGSENTRQIAIEMTPGADGSGIKGDYVELRIIQGAEQGYDPNRSIIISSPTNSDIRTPSKSDSVASSKSPIVSPTRSETLPSPFGTEMVTSPTRSEANSSGRVSMSSSMNRSGDDFDLKSLEKRIDSSTWRKKKSDLDSSCLPNADETEKSLEAVKALLDASINSQSVNANSTYSSLYNSSTIEGSYLSQGSRTVDGAAWRRFKETLSNVDQSEDEGESVWVRRDPESSKSEPELNKHLLNGKKGAKKDKMEGNKSFLPIKAMKSMFTSSKKEKSSKSGSKMSLSSSKESLYSHKIDMNEIVKAVEKEKEKRDKQEERRKQKEEKEREKERQKELEKEKQREKLKQKELLKEKHKEAANEAKKLKVNEKEKAKVKKEKLKKTEKVSRKSVSSEHDEMMESTIEESSLVLDNKNDSSVPSVTLESSPNKPAKSSPQSVLVPPFNYTPKECVKSSGNTEKEDSKPPSVKSPTTPAAVSVSSASPMTKTEMLLARRQQAYKNNLNKSSMEGSDLNTTTEKDKRGCMVTTV